MDVYSDVARNIMCEAYRKEMTLKQNYIWFLPNTFNWDWYDPVEVSCSREEMEEGNTHCQLVQYFVVI